MMESHGLQMLGDLDFGNNLAQNFVFEPLTELPTHVDSKPGKVAFFNRRVMICVEIAESVPMWIPLTQEMDTYKHTQDELSDTWVITHEMNTATAVVQLFDETGQIFWADEIDCSVEDVVTAKFSMPVKGSAIVICGRTEGLSKPDVVYTNSYASATTWVVNHNLGYEPEIRCMVGSFEAAPSSIVHVSTTVAHVTWETAVSGSVACI